MREERQRQTSVNRPSDSLQTTRPTDVRISYKKFVIRNSKVYKRKERSEKKEKEREGKLTPEE